MMFQIGFIISLPYIHRHMDGWIVQERSYFRKTLSTVTPGNLIEGSYQVLATRPLVVQPFSDGRPQGNVFMLCHMLA